MTTAKILWALAPFPSTPFTTAKSLNTIPATYTVIWREGGYGSLVASKPNVRPFILSHSTAASSGRFVNHWLGDNKATIIDCYSYIHINSHALFFLIASSTYLLFHHWNPSRRFRHLRLRWMEPPLRRCATAGSKARIRPLATGDIDSYFYLWESVTESQDCSYYPKICIRILHTELTCIFCPANSSEQPSCASCGLSSRPTRAPMTLTSSPCSARVCLSAEGSTNVTAYFPAGVWYNW
ncbi:hypothetical protein BC938DRAFT_483464 [Jimgerdemannia flammicorona]|uniref:Glycoside hydrolase family 31 TIM barrel domain-containing protein n=1 Tax=Jimgerdemannia flammicorona TaxID=994334 RepID=A0A433QC29_9FUNG|nr:hypothetical protein BC938DRAFT_483464 [Jimgerdemannia flammicorona]